MIGCDLGSRFAKLVSVSRSGSRWSLDGCVVLDRDEARAEEPEKLGTRLGVALTRVGVRRGPAVLGLGARLANLSYHRVPPVPDYHLRPLLGLEVEDLAGRSGSAISFDYRILPAQRRPDEELTVLMAMARDEEVLPVVQALAAAGLAVEDAMPSALGLYSAWRALCPPEEGASLVVDLGEREVTAILARDGEWAFARTARLPDPVPEALADVLYNMLRSTVIAAKTQLRSAELAPQRLVVTGGRAAQSGLAEQLAASFGVPLLRFDPTEHLDLSGCAGRPHGNDGYTLAIAVGLAIAAAGAMAALDLLPTSLKEKRTWKHRTRWFRAAGGVLAASVLLAAASAIWVSFAVDGWNEDLERLHAEVEGRAAVVRALRQENEDARAVVVALREQARPGAFLERVLGLVASASPSRLSVERVRLGSEEGRPAVVLSGSVDNAAESALGLIEAFAAALEQDPHVETARIEGGRTRLDPARGAVVFELRVEGRTASGPGVD